MKKTWIKGLAATLTIVGLFAFVGCGENKDGAASNNETAAQEEKTKESAQEEKSEKTAEDSQKEETKKAEEEEKEVTDAAEEKTGTDAEKEKATRTINKQINYGKRV